MRRDPTQFVNSPLTWLWDKSIHLNLHSQSQILTLYDTSKVCGICPIIKLSYGYKACIFWRFPMAYDICFEIYNLMRSPKAIGIPTLMLLFERCKHFKLVRFAAVSGIYPEILFSINLKLSKLMRLSKAIGILSIILLYERFKYSKLVRFSAVYGISPTMWLDAKLKYRKLLVKFSIISGICPLSSLPYNALSSCSHSLTFQEFFVWFHYIANPILSNYLELPEQLVVIQYWHQYSKQDQDMQGY